MPRYFLNVTEGADFIPDQEGVERDDFAAVQREAIQGVSDLIAEAVKSGNHDYEGRLDVQNERGETVLTVTFACPVQMQITAPASALD